MGSVIETSRETRMERWIIHLPAGTCLLEDLNSPELPTVGGTRTAPVNGTARVGRFDVLRRVETVGERFALQRGRVLDGRLEHPDLVAGDTTEPDRLLIRRGTARRLCQCVASLRRPVRRDA